MPPPIGFSIGKIISIARRDCCHVMEQKFAPRDQAKMHSQLNAAIDYM
jgi:hypothetical protein